MDGIVERHGEGCNGRAAWRAWVIRVATRLLGGDAVGFDGFDDDDRLDVLRCLAELLAGRDQRRRGRAV